MTIVVAIDGPAGSGKGTIARNISKKYDFPHLDSGSLYRGVAASVLEIGKKKIDERVALEVAKNLIPQAIDEKKIRNREVDEAASIVSSISGVRQSLKKLQRDFKKINENKNGIVVDGRDIGTVIFPNAEIKLFVTASLGERASRRHNEFIEKELKIDKKLIIKELQKRDQRDKERSIAPLKIAKGALILDTSNMSIDRVMEKVCLEIDKVIENLRK